MAGRAPRVGLVSSLLTLRLAGYTGNEWCTREGCDSLGSRRTRHYGEQIDIEAGLPGAGKPGFTGWRGPYCSAKCYRLAHPREQ